MTDYDKPVRSDSDHRAIPAAAAILPAAGAAGALPYRKGGSKASSSSSSETGDVEGKPKRQGMFGLLGK